MNNHTPERVKRGKGVPENMSRMEARSKKVIAIKISRKSDNTERWKDYVKEKEIDISLDSFTHVFSCPTVDSSTNNIRDVEFIDAICEGVNLIVRKRHRRDDNAIDPPQWVMEILMRQVVLSSFTFKPKKNDKRPLYLIAREKTKSFTLNQVIPGIKIIESLKNIQIPPNYEGRNPLLMLEPEMIQGLLSIVSMEVSMAKSCSVGRFYCKDKTEYIKTLQDCHKVIRRLACFDQYVDLDIKNSHPVILVQLLEIKKRINPNIFTIEYPTLQRYINNRDEVLEELRIFYGLKESGPVKELLLAIINGAQKEFFYYWHKKSKTKASNTHEIVQKFYFECADIQRAFHTESDDIYKLCLDRAREKKKKNEKASALSLYIQDVEASIGYVVVHFLKAKDIEVSMLIHDGLLIKKSPLLTGGLISQCMSVVRDNVGFDVLLRLKPFEITDQDKIDHMEAMTFVGESRDIVFGKGDLPAYHVSLEYRLFKFISPEVYRNTQKLKDVMRACVVAEFFLYDWLRYVKGTSELKESTLIYLFTKLKASLTPQTYYNPQAVLKKYAKEGHTKEYFEEFHDEIRREIENNIQAQFIDEGVLRERYGDAVTFLNRRYLSEKPLPIENVNGWEAPKGGGKTEAMKTHFIDKFDKVLCLTIRQSQARDFKRRFDIPCYLDDEDRNPELYCNKPKLICQLESLHHLRDRVPDDAILIDEIQSILNGLDSETISDNFMETIIILNQRLKTTKYVLLCDSDFNSTTLSVIDFLRKYPIDAMAQEKTLSVIVNQYNVTNRTIEKFGTQLTTGMRKEIEETKVFWLKKLVKLIKDGKRAFVVCATREMALRVQGYVKECCKSKSVKLYTSKEGDQTDFNNIEYKWRCQCLIVTTKVTVGLDFQTRWFHQLYLYVSCSEQGPLMRHLLQASMRVRNLLENNVVALILPKTNFGGNGSRVYKRNQELHVKNTSNKLWGLLTSEEQQQAELFNDAPWLKDAFINNRLEREIGIYHTHEYFNVFANRTGFHDITDENEDNEIFDDDGIPTNDPSWQFRMSFKDIEDVNTGWVDNYKNGLIEVDNKNEAEQKVSKYFLKKMFNLGIEGGLELTESIFDEAYFENTKKFRGGGFKMVSTYLPVIQVLLSDHAIDVAFRTIKVYQESQIMISAYHPKRMRPIRVKAVLELGVLLGVPDLLEYREIPKSVLEGITIDPEHFYKTFNVRSRFDRKLKASEMSVRQKITTFNMVMDETIGGHFRLEQKRVRKNMDRHYDGIVIFDPPFENIKERVYPAENNKQDPELLKTLGF
jgi:hypothetical protein